MKSRLSKIVCSVDLWNSELKSERMGLDSLNMSGVLAWFSMINCGFCGSGINRGEIGSSSSTTWGKDGTNTGEAG